MKKTGMKRARREVNDLGIKRGGQQCEEWGWGREKKERRGETDIRSIKGDIE